MTNKLQAKPKEHGQSMVELALSITLLMALLAGTIDLGRAYFTWVALRDAAQEAASYGSIRPGDVTGMRARVWDNLEQVSRNPQSEVTVDVSYGGSLCFGHTIQIDVRFPQFPITMPFLGTILGSQVIPIHATVNDTILSPMCP